MLMVDRLDDSTDYEKHASSGQWLSMYLSLVYIYSCRNVLEVHRYFSVCVEQTPSLFCKLFFSVRQKLSLVISPLLIKYIIGD